ncbi:MAG: SRPBCC domain-containing protein [Telluria sp.]
MKHELALNPKLDLVFERFLDAPKHLVWAALTQPEHVKQWYMPKQWGAVAQCAMDLRPGGAFSIDIRVANGQVVPNLGCFVEVVPEERLVWTSMLFPGYRPAVFDDVPITAILTMEEADGGTRYRFTALHRSEADLEENKASGWMEGTEIALDQLVEHVKSMRA